MTTLEPRTELAPSETRSEEPTVARMLGATGLGLLLLGTIAIIANQYGPRFVGTSGGYFSAAIGAALLLYHAHRDGDFEFRRSYTFLGYLITAAFVLTGILALTGRESFSGAGSLISPLLALFGLALLNATLQHETDANFRNITLLVWLAIGGLGSLGAVAAGIAQPAFLVGPGVVLALVSLAYLGAFLASSDSSQGVGFHLSVGLGILGGFAFAYALAKAIWPTVLYDGPAAIHDAFQKRDPWKVSARVLLILAFLGVAVWGWRARRAGFIARVGLIAFGLSFAGVFLYACFAKAGSTTPANYFVPSGLLLGLIGLLQLAVALACVSESAFIALTRREITSFFYSPIAYILLGGSALVASLGYANFLTILDRYPGGVPEPILSFNISFEIIAAIAALFIVPAITMRAFSEEKRNATLEVLLTAPVSEFSIVMSKFVACWLMYMLTFAPAGLYLIGLRAESTVGFDYRPLLSYYLAVGLCGIAFVGMGLFFSSLTNNQIVAAVLTFAGMLFLLLTLMIKQYDLGRGLQALVARLDFLALWQQALSGVLPIAQGITYASLGIFWLFLTVKVLEARKWG